MRIMVGLTRPTGGTVSFDGVSFVDLPSPGHVVGVMLDATAQHGGRSGTEVLTLTARSLGIASSRVREVLDLVGLSKTEAKRRIKSYSLGMRQRLGIANALLAEPEVLILDEPANGLDPSGIRWIRELLAAHADAGGTVLLSSHLIHEVELVADDLVLIGHGQVAASGTKDDLLQDLQAQTTVVDSDDNEALLAALSAGGHSAVPGEDGLTVTADPAVIGRVAVTERIALTHLSRVSGSLEDEFFRLTGAFSREMDAPTAGVDEPTDRDPGPPGRETGADTTTELTGAVR